MMCSAMNGSMVRLLRFSRQIHWCILRRGSTEDWTAHFRERVTCDVHVAGASAAHKTSYSCIPYHPTHMFLPERKQKSKTPSPANVGHLTNVAPVGHTGRMSISQANNNNNPSALLENTSPQINREPPRGANSVKYIVGGFQSSFAVYHCTPKTRSRPTSDTL